MSKFSRFLCVCALLLPAVLYGQSDSLRFSAKGVVRDADSGRIIPAVSVSVPGTSFATVSNDDGTFIIKSDHPLQTLSFSCLGYETISMPVPAGASEVMRVRMKRGSLTLDASLVVSGDPLAIMRLAISRIPDNCPSEPELFDCFYRETVRKRQRFIYVSEAVTKMYKSSFSDSFGRDRAAVVKSRLLTSPRKSDTLGVKVVGGPAMSVDLDIVKTRGVVLDPGALDYYRMEMLDPRPIDGRMQFVIRLSPAREADIALQNGTVYIDRETLAFTRIELSLDVSDEAKATQAMLVKRPLGIRFKPKEMLLVLDYKTEGGKSRISYLKTQFRFNCDWRKRLLATEFTAVSEMVVTNRRSRDEVEKISRAEAFDARTSLADKTSFYSDPDFWKDYNIIEPTVGLEQAVGRLKATE
ncbi:MAG: carboxypeptidase-like regulatory domain-containing protein [Bacteroidales bacterium]|nr:carboxypeptidase-like regulatory domain-containing protein [Bacteroidales bacterium]